MTDTALAKVITNWAIDAQDHVHFKRASLLPEGEQDNGGVILIGGSTGPSLFLELPKDPASRVGFLTSLATEVQRALIRAYADAAQLEFTRSVPDAADPAVPGPGTRISYFGVDITEDGGPKVKPLTSLADAQAWIAQHRDSNAQRALQQEGQPVQTPVTPRPLRNGDAVRRVVPGRRPGQGQPGPIGTVIDANPAGYGLGQVLVDIEPYIIPQAFRPSELELVGSSTTEGESPA